MAKPVRLLISHYRSDILSGAELAIADMVDRLDKHIQFTMLVPGEGNLAAAYRLKGFQVWVKMIQTRRRRFPGLHTIQSILLARELKLRSYDEVLCNTFASASRVGTACRMAKIPYGVYVREYISDKSLHRAILDKANIVLAVSKDLQAHVSAMTSPEKVRVAYDSINASPILERVAKHKASGIRLMPFDRKNPVVGLVGRITPYKQQDLFIRSIPLVLSAVPEARFVVVGSARENEKDYEAFVKSLAVELGVHGQVAFMGQRKDSVELLSELSIACLTSTREPLGRVILEAQLLGIPLVASNTGGTPEIVEDEVTGLLFSACAEDAREQLASQIIRLLRSSQLRQAVATQALQSMQNTFSGPRPVRQLENYLDELAKSNAVSGP